MKSDPEVEEVSVRAFEVPTDAPESDGTLEWSSTTMVLVSIRAGGETGVGYTYADVSVAALIRGKLAGIVEGRPALDIPAAWRAMVHATRNLGRPGLVSMGVAAVDAALWDLKGKLLGLPLSRLLGRARDSIAVYGSGGFTSYDDARLSEQLGGWAADGLGMVKMKVGREPARDPHRMEVARAGDRSRRRSLRRSERRRRPQGRARLRRGRRGPRRALARGAGELERSGRAAAGP